MDWKEKINMTLDAVTTFDRLKICFSVTRSLSNGAWRSQLVDKYRFLDPEYLTFLGLFDGAQFESCVICGSDGTAFPFEKAMRTFQRILPEGAISIGLNGMGDPLIMLPSHEIVLGNRLPFQARTVVSLARNFADFLSDVVMGPGFPKVYEKTWDDIQENEWTAYLRLRGWHYAHE